MKSTWKIALMLDSMRNITAGSRDALRAAIQNGADLRIYTEFKHNEHIDAKSDNTDLVQEVSDFPCTYLLGGRWVAAMMTFRQPVTLPDRFGDRASASFFMYNEDGHQAIARPFLDGQRGIDTELDNPAVCLESKFHRISTYDDDTNAPSANFIYDFFSYRFLVNDVWEEICACDAEGRILYGSARAIEEASNAGCELKLGISGICEGLWGIENTLPHEVFVQTGSHYFYHNEGVMVAETRPFVRVEPGIPTVYKSQKWDFGWVIARSDGRVAGLWYDPYTLKPFRTFSRHPMRWFAR